MNLKSICIFNPTFTQYGVLTAFSNELAQALNRQGVRCRILTAQPNDPQLFLKQIAEEAPDATLSFNGLLPDANGQFLCDITQIPHVNILVDSPKGYLKLIGSPLNIITCIDPAFCKVFADFGFTNTFFLPHGVDKDLAPAKDENRIYDVVLLASCIDHHKIHKEWRKKYTPSLCHILEEAVEEALSGEAPSYLHAFSATVNRQIRGPNPIEPHTLPYEELLNDLECYLIGLDRIELLKSIQDFPVHVFGANNDYLGDWKKALGNHSSVTIHPAIPYYEALEIMKKSRIVLNSSPTVCSHERIFAGLACGAAVLTNDNAFVRENFSDGADILLYKTGEWDKVNDILHQYLDNENKREKLAAKGRDRVLQAHTWDHRAKTLIEELKPILESIRCL